MGRKVHFGEQEVTLFLTDLHPFLALKHKISMPYSNIESVNVDYFDAPQMDAQNARHLNFTPSYI